MLGLNDDKRMIAYRYATAGDIDCYYGHRPKQTVRAVMVLMDDEPIGIIGIAKHGEVMHCFSEFKPELAPHLKCMTALRAIKLAMRMVKDSQLPVYARAESENGLLERLGFVRIHEDLYQWRS